MGELPIRSVLACVSHAGSGWPGVSGTTGAAGAVTLATMESAKGRVQVTFCVTGITHPALQDYTGTPADCASN